MKKTSQKIKYALIFTIIVVAIIKYAPAFAYTTNMSASAVLGQPNFTTNIPNYSSTASNLARLPNTRDLGSGFSFSVGGANYIYQLGGRDLNGVVSSTVYRSTIDNTGKPSVWTTSSQTQLPQAIWEQATVTVTTGGNSYVYLIGGRDVNNAYLTTVYRASIDSSGNIGAWSTSGQGQLPVALVATNTVFTASISGTNYIYMVGGRNSGGTPVLTVYKATIDGSGNIGTWSTTSQGQLPQATVFGSVNTTSIGGTQYAYMIGGSANNSTAKVTVYRAVIDGSGNIGAWSTTSQGQLPVATMFMNAAIVDDGANGSLYMFGGVLDNAVTLTYYSSVYKASLDSSGNVGTWSTSGQTALPTAIAGYALGTITLGQTTYVYGIGGDTVGFGATVGMFRATISGGNVVSTEDDGYLPGNFGMSFPERLFSDGTRLFLSEFGNNRTVIYNSLPTSSSDVPNVVVGQANFTSSDISIVAANTLYAPFDAFSDGARLFIADANNNRVLIYNRIPTTNNAAADIVIGQSSMSTSGNGTSSTTLRTPESVYYDSETGKLYIADSGNNRILIYNRVPTTNGAAADVVLGQSGSMTTRTTGTTASKFSFPNRVRIFDHKLVINDPSNNRVLIYNTVPTTDVPADIVVGQADFTHGSANQGSSIGANTLSNPIDISYDGSRFYITDYTNNRVLAYRGIPKTNNATASEVIGQADFTHGSANQGGSIGANGFDGPTSAFAINNILYVADGNNNRVLLFDNVTNKPVLSLGDGPEGARDNTLRLKGAAKSDTSDSIQTVKYSINNGIWNISTPSDGSFDSAIENYYFTFDPKSNQPHDLFGVPIDGYTVRVQSTDSNYDVTDNLFYFQPFNLTNPPDKVRTVSANPLFEFSVNKQRASLRDNLSRYQIWIEQTDIPRDQQAWQLLIDDIPIDRENGDYDTNSYHARYSEDSSHIAIFAKKGLNDGTYQWKVLAKDKTGHTQQGGQREIWINRAGNFTLQSGMPLTLMTISGFGNVNASTLHPFDIKPSYATGFANPTFYGITNVDAKVTLTLLDKTCVAKTKSEDTCKKVYEGMGNQDSRFGINLPQGELKYGRDYSATLSVTKDNVYNQLPTFNLHIGLK